MRSSSAAPRESPPASSAPPSSASPGSASSPIRDSAAATSSSTERPPSWGSSKTTASTSAPPPSPPSIPAVAAWSTGPWTAATAARSSHPTTAPSGLRRVYSPVDEDVIWFSAAVLCAAQGCDHYGCQGGPFRLAVVTTNDVGGVASGWLYSSETHVWRELTSVGHPKVACYANQGAPSVLVGDALYFNIDGTIEFHLGKLCLSKFEKPIAGKGRLMTAQGGGLGFIAMVDVTNLILWSREARPKGDMVWTKLRVIDLKKLLPAGALSTQTVDYGINGIAEGTQVVFVSTCLGSYMVDLKSRQVRMVSVRGRNITPYMSFYIPAIKAASTSQGQRAGASSVRRAGARGRR